MGPVLLLILDKTRHNLPQTKDFEESVVAGGERCFWVPWVGLICRLWRSPNRIAHYLAYYLFLVNANRRTVSEKVAVLYFCAVSQVAVLKCFAIFPVFIEFQNSSEKNVK